MAEQIERLAGAFEIHLYSSRAEDINLSEVTWHRVPALGGPHLFAYVWWLAANRFLRWRDAKFRGIAPDIVFSPGVNCLDADIVSVHVLFSKVRGQDMGQRRTAAWPVIFHRKIYYRLIESLENRVYGREDIFLAAVSEKGAQDIRARFGQKKHLSVIYHGVDSGQFNPQRRQELRLSARGELGLAEDAFAILFIGNDWRNRGLPCLLEAVAMMQNPRARVLVVGTDSTAGYLESIEKLGLTGRVSFLPPRRDVEFYYAAADAYAGPSLEDTFSLPPAEAMACGLPVITTRAAGASEIIHHDEDGLVLENPADAETLSEWLARLARDADWSERLGAAAVKTTSKYTWERNAQELRAVIDSVLETRRVSG